MSDARPAINCLMNHEGFEVRAAELGITVRELWRRMADGRHADWRPLRGLVRSKSIVGGPDCDAAASKYEDLNDALRAVSKEGGICPAGRP